MANDNVPRGQFDLLKKQKENAETRQVELEKMLEQKNFELHSFEAKILSLEEDIIQLNQKLLNAQTTKAMSYGLEPAQLALLVLQAIPLSKDANGNPIAPKGVEDHIKLVSERQIPTAMRIVRSTLDEIAKLS